MASAAPPNSGGPPVGLPPPPPPPKILLAKPLGSSPAVPRREDDPSAVRSRSSGSLNLLSHSWDLHTDRVLPFLTENSDFMVVGIIGPPGVGKSTIMNELYGSDGTSPGMLPPFATQSDETRAMAKHCTMGIELRVSSERIILLDAQPIFSPSILVDIMRPDGSSTVPILNGESLSADLAHELMGIQLGVFLASICNVLLVVSEGINDFNMWHLMLTVDLLKHRIPDPSLAISMHSQNSNPGSEIENKGNVQASSEEHMAALVFVHTKVRDQDISHNSIMRLRKALSQYFGSSSFNVNKDGNLLEVKDDSSGWLNTQSNDSDYMGPHLFVLPSKAQDGDVKKAQFESYCSMLGRLRDQILSMNHRSFAKTMSERDWLRNSSKIWELVKKSPIIADYCRALQNSGLFRSPMQHGVDPTMDKRKDRRRSASGDKWS